MCRRSCKRAAYAYGIFWVSFVCTYFGAQPYSTSFGKVTRAQHVSTVSVNQKFLAFTVTQMCPDFVSTCPCTGKLRRFASSHSFIAVGASGFLCGRQRSFRSCAASSTDLSAAAFLHLALPVFLATAREGVQRRRLRKRRRSALQRSPAALPASARLASQRFSAGL